MGLEAGAPGEFAPRGCRDCACVIRVTAGGEMLSEVVDASVWWTAPG